MPCSATAMHTAVSTTPAASTGSTPMRRISGPVKKLGTYMPSTCTSSTQATAWKGCEQTCIAIGVAAISRFITP
jgi:hypothetical protein